MPISILIFLLIIILILIICSIVVNSINIPNYIIKEGGKKRKVYGGIYKELEDLLTELRGMGDLNKEEILNHLTVKFEELKDKYRAKIEECRRRLLDCNEHSTGVETAYDHYINDTTRRLNTIVIQNRELQERYDELEMHCRHIMNQFEDQTVDYSNLQNFFRGLLSEYDQINDSRVKNSRLTDELLGNTLRKNRSISFDSNISISSHDSDALSYDVNLTSSRNNDWGNDWENQAFDIITRDIPRDISSPRDSPTTLVNKSDKLVFKSRTTGFSGNNGIDRFSDFNPNPPYMFGEEISSSTKPKRGNNPAVYETSAENENPAVYKASDVYKSDKRPQRPRHNTSDMPLSSKLTKLSKYNSSNSTGLLSFGPKPDVNKLQLSYPSSSNENSPQVLQKLIDQLQIDKQELAKQVELLREQIKEIEHQNGERIKKLLAQNIETKEALEYSFRNEQKSYIENITKYKKIIEDEKIKYTKDIKEKERLLEEKEDLLKEKDDQYEYIDEQNDIFQLEIEELKSNHKSTIEKYEYNIQKEHTDHREKIKEYTRKIEEQDKKIEEYKNLIQQQEKLHNEQISNLELGHEKAIYKHLEGTEKGLQKAMETTDARIEKEMQQLQNTLETIEDSQSKIMAMVHRNRIANNQKITNMNKMVNSMLAQLGNN